MRAQVGYMPESDSFISGMTGLRFVRYMAEISGLPAEQAMERAHEAFFYVGLGEVRYRKLGTYSLGMKQLAKLAQAIAHGPKMLIMDEPTNGLDPPARQRMIQLVREIRDASDMRLSFLLTCCEMLKRPARRFSSFAMVEWPHCATWKKSVAQTGSFSRLKRSARTVRSVPRCSSSVASALCLPMAG